MTRHLRACLVGFALALPLGTAACSQPAASPDTATADLAMANAQLEGDWRIVSFHPDTPLEPNMAALISAQLQTMNLRFEGKEMTGSSPSLRVKRTYRVSDAAGPRFTVVVVDEMGVGYETKCEFTGPEQISFRSTNRPWTGTGTLVRAGRLPPR